MKVAPSGLDRRSKMYKTIRVQRRMAIEVYQDGRTTKGQAICPYCGVGCRLWMESAYNDLIRIKAVADAPANLGGICAKGATLHQVVNTPDRLMQPHVRVSRAKELR